MYLTTKIVQAVKEDKQLRLDLAAKLGMVEQALKNNCKRNKKHNKLTCTAAVDFLITKGWKKEEILTDTKDQLN